MLFRKLSLFLIPIFIFCWGSQPSFAMWRSGAPLNNTGENGGVDDEFTDSEDDVEAPNIRILRRPFLTGGGREPRGGGESVSPGFAYSPFTFGRGEGSDLNASLLLADHSQEILVAKERLGQGIRELLEAHHLTEEWPTETDELIHKFFPQRSPKPISIEVLNKRILFVAFLLGKSAHFAQHADPKLAALLKSMEIALKTFERLNEIREKRGPGFSHHAGGQWKTWVENKMKLFAFHFAYTALWGVAVGADIYKNCGDTKKHHGWELEDASFSGRHLRCEYKEISENGKYLSFQFSPHLYPVVAAVGKTAWTFLDQKREEHFGHHSFRYNKTIFALEDELETAPHPNSIESPLRIWLERMRIAREDSQD